MAKVDVGNIKSEFDKAIQWIVEQKTGVESSKEAMNTFNTETVSAFVGEAGNSARAYAEDVYQPLARQALHIEGEFTPKLTLIQKKAEEEFGGKGIVDSGYVEELNLQINQSIRNQIQGIDELNKSMQEVSDIVMLEKLETVALEEVGRKINLHCQETLEKLNNFDSTTASELQSVTVEIDVFKRMIDEFNSKKPSVDGYRIGGFKFSNLSRMTNEEKEKYDKLPQEFKTSIDSGKTTIADYELTEDGLILCKKTLKEINPEYNDSNSMNWAVYCVIVDGKPEYGIYKIKTVIENINESYTSTSFKLSFANIRTDSVADVMSGKVTKGSVEDIYRATYGEGNTTNDKLAKYFTNENNQGAYLFSDLYVTRVISEIKKNGTSEIDLKENYDKIQYNKEQREALERFGCLDGKKIKIKDLDNLTEQEYNSILLGFTGNTSSHNFASEIYLHADNVHNLGAGKSAQISDHNAGLVYRNIVNTVGEWLLFEMRIGRVTEKFEYYNYNREAIKHKWTQKEVEIPIEIVVPDPEYIPTMTKLPF